MGGSAIEEDWEFSSPSTDMRTVVLVGRTGNGKSATGNSILGRKAFKSLCSHTGVTSTCEQHSTLVEDERIINVVDTPGLFDAKADPEFLGKEIVKCVDLAKDGIHAVLMVLSIRSRFSIEEKAVVTSLKMFFGENITDYMILVFTGGDDLEENEMSLDDYLSREGPAPLLEILELCGNRRVVFDNKTKDQRKKAEQLDNLLSLVDDVVLKNGGKPYTDDLFTELKKGAMRLHDHDAAMKSLEGHSKQEISELKDQMYRSHEEQMKRIIVMVELKLRETTGRLEQQLAEEQKARETAMATAKEAQVKSDDEIRKLREHLERAQKENEEFRKHAGKCTIL